MRYLFLKQKAAYTYIFILLSSNKFLMNFFISTPGVSTYLYFEGFFEAGGEESSEGADYQGEETGI